MSRVTPILCPLLVGRDDLLDLADRRLGNAAEGHGQFLLLAGEAGVGKSRFLGAIDRKAESRGFLTACGAVAPQDRIVPGALILDLARTMLRIPAFAELGNDLLGLPQVEDGGASRSRRLLVIDMVDQIAAALDSPAMLAFEDLQWADDLSLEILAELARRIRDQPVLLVGAYRTDELPTGTNLREWRARLLTQRLAEEARLAPLTLEGTALMATLILDTGLPAPRDVVSAVHERTDGIPLHIEELLGALGDDARSDGSAIREATVPATIEDAVLARFERLTPDARAVAQAGAVIGRCFVPEVLAGIMDLPINALDAPLEELLGQSFLEPPGSRGLFDFRHQLLRDALYRTIPPAALRRLHARAGEFGAQLEGASEIHASVHFECAGLREEAFRAALSGARAAAKVSSHREALELYERAVRNLSPDLDEAEHAEILEAFSEEAGASDENEVAERIAGDALERFLAAGRPIDAARVRGSMAWLWRRLGRPVSDRIEIVEAGLAELAGTEPSLTGDEVRAFLLTTLARMHLDAMALDEARRIALEGQVAATAVGDAETAFGARALLGAADALTGDVEGGFTKMGAAAREGRSHQFSGALSAYRDVAAMAARHMRYRQSEAWLQEGIAYAATIDQWHCRYNMTATLSLVAWSDARWDEAVAVAGQVLADRRGGVAAETIAHAALGYVAFGRGDLARARELLERSLSAGMPSGEVTRTLPAMWGLAETDLADGDAAAAIRRCEDALDTGLRTGERALVVPFLVTGARAYLAAGRPEDAERWVTRGSTFLATLPTVAQPAIDHGRGLIRLAAGSTGGAREALEAAVKGWDQRDRIWESTWARLDLASCLVRSNRYADAAALVAKARATATRLDSAPLLARADELARVGRGRGTFEEPWHPLTAREFEVARLIADGMTNAEIGGELSISPKTASAHVEHILAKLGVARRAEIAAWAANVAGSKNGSATSDRPVLARR